MHENKQIRKQLAALANAGRLAEWTGDTYVATWSDVGPFINGRRVRDKIFVQERNERMISSNPCVDCACIIDI